MGNTISTRHIPTARRVREIAFKILSRRVRAGRFLDLCAGCGMVGLDALSRGAMIATFVDRSSRMCDIVRKNLEVCGIKDGHGEVIEAEVVPFLKQMLKRKRFWDIVYFGPPDNADHDAVLEYFGHGTAIARGGLLLIEHHKELFFPEKLGILKRSRVVVIDDKALSFYERK
jgi:16S rRNA (guanine(966)-N(2))-methyltransferase RsmD